MQFFYTNSILIVATAKLIYITISASLNIVCSNAVLDVS